MNWKERRAEQEVLNLFSRLRLSLIPTKTKGKTYDGECKHDTTLPTVWKDVRKQK